MIGGFDPQPIEFYCIQLLKLRNSGHYRFLDWIDGQAKEIPTRISNEMQKVGSF